ncbi:MAG: diguanylate cyclase [Xanthomonadales bacterium]|nr:diguanylate cyclase [Xanthomonadales bacterium]
MNDARRANRGLPLRSQFARGLLLATLVPALLLGGSDLIEHHGSQRRLLQDRLVVSTTLSAAAIDGFIGSHLAAITLAARLGAAQPDWNVTLAELHRNHPDFISTLVTDAGGRVVDLHSDLRTAQPGGNVADREYFTAPRDSGLPFVSNAFVGRRLGSDPLVAISAPLVREGAFAGVLEGSIRVDAFTAQRAAAMHALGIGMLLLDREGHVIHASAELPYRFEQSLAGASFLDATAGAEPHKATPARRLDNLLPDGNDAWVSAARLTPGWTLVLFAPDTILASTLRSRSLPLVMLMMLVAAGVWLAYAWQMRKFEKAIGDLTGSLQQLARAPTGQLREDALPAEFRPLGKAIGDLAFELELANDELVRSLHEQSELAASLQRSLDEREREVNDRTAQLRQANAELERLTRTDPLTGSLNRRGLQARLANVLDEHGRLLVDLAVIALDVDHFKAYNDRYGHPEGDVALRRVASAIPGTLDDTGAIFARTGGEEFIVLAKRIDAPAAARCAERVRAGIEAKAIPHRDSPWGVITVSVGLAHAPAGTDQASVFLRADEALYAAKKRGRNRVEIAADGLSGPAGHD